MKQKKGGGKVWPDELTDAAVEIFASEENNRQQRRKKREERKKKDITMIHDNYGINEKGHLTVCGADTVKLAKNGIDPDGKYFSIADL